MKNLLIFFLVFISLTPLRGEEINYSLFKSINEVIEYETSQIFNADLNDYEDLSENYLSRAETYLLCKEIDLAFSDFQKGYEFGNLCQEEVRNPLLFRSLFGLAIVYGCKDMRNEVNVTVNALKAILSSYKCDCDLANTDHSLLAFILLPNTTCADQPLLGPERISIQECIDFALGTARKCKYLISIVPKTETRLILEILIDDLERQAINCCVAGGIWKACLQPIVNKWYLWNQKWNLLSIPPDPAWD